MGIRASYTSTGALEVVIDFDEVEGFKHALVFEEQFGFLDMYHVSGQGHFWVENGSRLWTGQPSGWRLIRSIRRHMQNVTSRKQLIQIAVALGWPKDLQLICGWIN